MRNYIKRLLGGRFDIIATANGKEALRIIQKDIPDLILTDVMMPDMDGLSLVTILKGDLQTARIPVIMLSARAGEEAKVEGLDAGADDYLVKPFSANELIARVSALITAARTRHETESRLYDLFMQCPAAVVILEGPEFIIKLVNPITLGIWGRRHEDLINKPLLEALPEIRGQGLDVLLREVQETGNPYVGHELKVRLDRNGDGTLEDVYFTFTYSPLRNAQGAIEGVMVFAYEVNEQVTARQEAQESARTLRIRVQQQAVVSELGLLALSGTDLRALMDEAAKKLRDVLGVEYTKVLELLPGGKEVILRAGLGWHKDIIIDKSTVDTGENSQAGYTLLSSEAVIVKDLRTEKRFNGPPLLTQHKVISGMSCIIWGRQNKPYGVLGVHTTRPRDFTRDDVNFLQAVANVLATAIQRKQDEEELHYHATITQHIADGVIGTDMEHKIRSWNKGAEKIYGWKEEEVIGKHAGEVLPTSYYNSNDHSNDWLKSLTASGFWNGEVTQKCKDGRSIPILASLAYVNDNHGRHTGMVAVNRDITDRKVAEEKLQRSEERYHSLFNSIDQGFCIVEVIFNDVHKAVDYRFLEVNPMFEKMTGIRNSTGKRMREIAPLHEEYWFEIYGRVALNGKSVRFQSEASSLNRFFDVFAFRIGEPDERNVAILFNDITERKQAEEALKRSEEFSRTLIESTPDCVKSLDLKGNLISMNEQGMKMMGIDDFSRYKGRSWLTFWGGEFRERSVRAYEDALAGHTGRFQGFSVAAQGTRRWWDVLVAPIYGVDGRTERLIAVSRDITQQKELEHQKDDFIAIASHELKTPITSIGGYTHVLKARLQAGQDQFSTDLLTKMDAQLIKLTTLITDLLDVSRIEQGKLRFREEYFYFNELVTEIVEEMQGTAKNHRIHVDLNADLKVWGDRDRIGQVLINFLTNALKYSAQADKIIVKTSIAGKEKVILSVQDFGLGLAEEDHLKVFERFYRVEETGLETYPGLGLGLFITAGIIERHGGEVWVESKKGKGSTFYFSLPLKKGNA